MNITFKILFCSQFLCFSDDGLLAAASHLPALMIDQRAKTAAAETASTGHDAEFNFSKCRYAAFFFIHRMILIFKGKFVDVIQFRTVQWRLRLILDYIYRVRIFFHQPLTVNIVIASVLQGKTLTVSLFGIYNLLKIGADAAYPRPYRGGCFYSKFL